MTAKSSDFVKLQPVDSLFIKNADVTINGAPKKCEYAVTDRLAGYLARTGACVSFPIRLNILHRLKWQDTTQIELAILIYKWMDSSSSLISVKLLNIFSLISIHRVTIIILFYYHHHLDQH